MAAWGGKTTLMNAEAEMALLGCVMFDAVALDMIGDLRPDHFGEPLFEAVFATIRELQAEGRAPLLEMVAGRAKTRLPEGDGEGLFPLLVDMVDRAPPVANVKEYADEIMGHALRRDLYRFGDKVASLASKGAEPPEVLLQEAEKALLGMRLDTGRNRAVSAAEAVAQVFEALDAEAAAGVSTGLAPLDKHLGPLLPGDLIIGAGRPGAGKSAWAGCVGTNVATAGKGVFEVSLEMSVPQLFRRRLCDVAHRMNPELAPAYSDVRRKQITPAQRALLHEAAHTVSALPIVSIARSGVTPSMVLSMARRQITLWSRAGIEPGLLIIDHLGLVVGDGRGRYESQTDVAIKTKETATELQMPVLALAQLSRKIEERDDKRPVLSDLRDCVTGDTRVQLASGELARIDSLVGTAPRVVAHAGGRQIIAQANDIWLVGEREVFDVELRSGRKLRCTVRHRLLGPRGWARVEDVGPGFRIAVARSIPEPEAPEAWDDRLVALLGQMIGDGTYCRTGSPGYVSADAENLAAAEAGAAALGCRVHRYAYPGKTQLSFAGNGHRWKREGMLAWMEALGIRGERSGTKGVPAAAFRMSNAQVSLLLRHLWATDGHIGVHRNRPVISYTSKSRRLAEDVLALLSRFGVGARVIHRPQHDDCYLVEVRPGDYERFAGGVGAFGPRVEPLSRVMAGRTFNNTNVDTLPREFTDDLRAHLREAGVSHRAYAEMMGVELNGSAQWKACMGRDRARRAAVAVGSEALLGAANAEVFWDEIVSITPAGVERVYDISVPGPESWIANGIVSHNSGAFEENADLVIGFYRDAYYAEHEPEPKKDLAWAEWNARKASKDIEAMLLKVREGRRGSVTLWGDMARNAIRAAAPSDDDFFNRGTF